MVPPGFGIRSFGAGFLFQTGKSAAISLFCAVVDENRHPLSPKLL
ncbi:hypothetical protein CEV32_2690 [Brucella rhizosphaerae]|uniref:Uncharacterized protein n=1 Tax=Brucella rhizosphaerae TaxID=571254 RepID=A0A256F635_9HYPH|nr:hypothetical protein CEV32_2690 [Brucella rhizosphaerae]